MYYSGDNSESNYSNLSRVFRSNLFPTVERKWTSSAKSTYIDHQNLNGVPNKQNFRHQDWLGKWHERDAHRLNVLRGSDEKYQERMKRVRHSIDLPSITRQAKAKQRSSQRPNQKKTLSTTITKQRRSVDKGTTKTQLPSLNIPEEKTSTLDDSKKEEEDLRLPSVDTKVLPPIEGNDSEENVSIVEEGDNLSSDINDNVSSPAEGILNEGNASVTGEKNEEIPSTNFSLSNEAPDSEGNTSVAVEDKETLPTINAVELNDSEGSTSIAVKDKERLSSINAVEVNDNEGSTSIAVDVEGLSITNNKVSPREEKTTLEGEENKETNEEIEEEQK